MLRIVFTKSFPKRLLVISTSALQSWRPTLERSAGWMRSFLLYDKPTDACPINTIALVDSLISSLRSMIFVPLFEEITASVSFDIATAHFVISLWVDWNRTSRCFWMWLSFLNISVWQPAPQVYRSFPVGRTLFLFLSYICEFFVWPIESPSKCSCSISSKNSSWSGRSVCSASKTFLGEDNIAVLFLTGRYTRIPCDAVLSVRRLRWGSHHGSFSLEASDVYPQILIGNSWTWLPILALYPCHYHRLSHVRLFHCYCQYPHLFYPFLCLITMNYKINQILYQYAV